MNHLLLLVYRFLGLTLSSPRICILIVSAGMVWESNGLWGAEPVGGWRGNQTGLWSEGQPPLNWQRQPQGALTNLRAQLDRPADALKFQSDQAPLVEKGQIRSWLVLGPFSVRDTKEEFDRDMVGGESTVEPSVGERLGDRIWKVAQVKPDDPNVFGEAGIPWLDLVPAIGFERSQLAYAHTYLYSPQGGRARVVADHSWGLKAWLNGREVFRHAERRVVLGAYPGLSRLELDHATSESSAWEMELQPGWNRLLIKLSTPGPNGHAEMQCSLRIMEPTSVRYQSQNIGWMTELPGRSTSTPIVVGERLFVMCEPDELVCIDRQTGKIVWSALINLYSALTAEERQAKPEFGRQVDPLVARLQTTADRVERVRLRGQIAVQLQELDRARFFPARDGHFDAHFGIVGFTMPTPISDGAYVYVWSGQGVAACFDLQGERRWIQAVKTAELSYSSSPALVDGVFAIFQGHLMGLDTRTGKVVWEQPRVNKNVAGLLSAKLGGEPVIVTQEGEVVRPRDGHLLYRPRGIVKNDTGWTPGVVLGDFLYLPKYGVKQLNVLDFAGQRGDAWEPRHVGRIETPDELNHRGKNWLDRSTAASPLVVGQYAYMVDMYSELCVYDLKAQKVVHHRTLDLNGFTHYNALAVAASPAFVAGHLLIMDNQGTTLVLTLGPEPKLVHRNVIATQLSRAVPIPGQETLAYAPPIVAGDQLFIRGERYLYCIQTPVSRPSP